MLNLVYKICFMRFKKIVVFAFLFISFFSSAQNVQDIIEGLKNDLKSNPSLKQTATIYSDLTWYYSNVSIDSAIVYGDKAIKTALTLGDSVVIAQAYGDVSTVFLKKGDFNESLKYLNKVLEIRKARKDIIGLAKVYSGIGLLYYNQNKYNLSMKYYLLALENVNKTNDEKVKYNIKNAMSGLLLDLKDYKKALLYSNQAISYYEKNNAASVLCPMYINKGNILIGLKDTINALKMFEKGRVLCGETGNTLFQSKALTNIGIIKVAQKKYNESKKLFNESKVKNVQFNSEAINFRMKLNDVDILNREKKFNESKVILLQLKKFFKDREDNENLLTTYKELIPVCAYLLESDSVAYYQIEYLNLNKAVNDAEVFKKTLELETKYQTAEKEKQLLQKEAEAKKKTTTIIILSLLALFIAIVGFLIYRQQRLKNTQQKQEFELQSAIAQIENQNKLHEQRLAISRDLHDNIGAQLTFIISSVENLKFGFPTMESPIKNHLTKISDFTKTTIVELRDTIWAMNANEFTFDDLSSRIYNFIEKAQSAKENTTFKFTVDESLKNSKFSSLEGVNLYRTIQEAVNNAIKYADATEVLVQVQPNNEGITIVISDNGKGFDIDAIDLGNGIVNMQKRIEEIGGIFNINSEIAKGTQITISLNK